MLGRLLSIPEIAVNVVRVKELGGFAIKLVPWVVPGGMFAGW